MKAEHFERAAETYGFFYQAGLFSEIVGGKPCLREVSRSEGTSMMEAPASAELFVKINTIRRFLRSCQLGAIRNAGLWSRL